MSTSSDIGSELRKLLIAVSASAPTESRPVSCSWSEMPQTGLDSTRASSWSFPSPRIRTGPYERKRTSLMFPSFPSLIRSSRLVWVSQLSACVTRLILCWQEGMWAVDPSNWERARGSKGTWSRCERKRKRKQLSLACWLAGDRHKAVVSYITMCSFCDCILHWWPKIKRPLEPCSSCVPPPNNVWMKWSIFMRLVKKVMILRLVTCVRKVPGSNVKWDGCRDWHFSQFSSFLHVNTEINTY